MIDLTRLFYNKEEVIYSFTSSLLKKRDIIECYFWAFELLYSGVNIFEIIWEIYYDYYSVLNPKMEKFISKKHTEWESDNDEEHICCVIHNLFILSHSYEIYMMRQTALAGYCSLVIPKCSNKMKGYLKKYDKKYHNLLISINKRLLNNICYYLQKLMESDPSGYYDIHRVICYFIVETLGFDTSDQERMEKIIKICWDIQKYTNKFHSMLSVIYQLYLDEELIHKKNIYIAPESEHIEYVKTLKDLPGICGSRRLMQNCHFGIDQNIGCIKSLERFKYDSYSEELKKNLQYHTYNSTYWKNILLDKNMLDDDDAEETEIYTKYIPDFDEVSEEVREAIGLFNMEKSEKGWIHYIYEEDPEVAGLTFEIDRLNLD